MCGIAGLLGSFPPDLATLSLRRMNHAQAHRGPDDEGVRIISTPQGVVGLAHRRLSILDLSPSGHQPMENPETGDLIVYNGELYNFREIREDLKSRGIAFRSDSDTEVILRAYQVWGHLCLNRFRGMFAFGLWDFKGQRLFLARDHAGIKPLYYTPGSPFLFASEVRALIASGQVSRQIDTRAVASYLAYGCVQSPLTIFNGVRMLEPACWMEVDSTGEVVERKPYWSIPLPERGTRNRVQELEEEARHLLAKSVTRHTISDVPIGIFLSSGLDSTSVAGLASQNGLTKPETFTVSFAEVPDHDEGRTAAETSERFGLEHHDCSVSNSTVLGWVEGALGCLDQPTMDGLNTYIVSRAVRERGITVALSGQGGDEMFGGYPSFRDIPHLYRLLSFGRYVPSDLRTIAARLATNGKEISYREKAIDMARTGPKLAELYFHRRRTCSESQMTALGFAAEDLGLTRSFHLPGADGSECVVDGDPVASIGRLESKYYLGNTLLRDGDVFGMANSLEIRVPLLDYDLMDWVFRLPGSVLLPSSRPNKNLLRKACADLLPDKVTTQGKRGFVVPVSRWMKGPLRHVVAEGLDAVKSSGLVRQCGLDSLLANYHQAPETPIWSRVWSLVTLGHWLRNSSRWGAHC